MREGAETVGSPSMRVNALHLIGGFIALVAMYNVYISMAQTPHHDDIDTSAMLQSTIAHLRQKLADSDAERSQLRDLLQEMRREIKVSVVHTVWVMLSGT